MLLFFKIIESIKYIFTNSVPISLQINTAEIMAQIPTMSLTKIKEKCLLIVTIFHL